MNLISTICERYFSGISKMCYFTFGPWAFPSHIRYPKTEFSGNCSLFDRQRDNWLILGVDNNLHVISVLITLETWGKMIFFSFGFFDSSYLPKIFSIFFFFSVAPPVVKSRTKLKEITNIWMPDSCLTSFKLWKTSATPANTTKWWWYFTYRWHCGNRINVNIHNRGGECDSLGILHDLS